MSCGLSTVVVLTLLQNPAQGLFALNAARPYIEPTNVPLPATLAMNMTVSEQYSPFIERMLRLSATFRRQCARIGRSASLQVTVKQAPPELLRSDGAATILVRGEDGRVSEAQVYIAPLRNPVELIAHEFEHILEQLDDVDLASMVLRRGTGVRVDSSTGRYETDRAIAAGRRVAAEVSRAHR